jgi:hypothetical protein
MDSGTLPRVPAKEKAGGGPRQWGYRTPPEVYAADKAWVDEPERRILSEQFLNRNNFGCGNGPHDLGIVLQKTDQPPVPEYIERRVHVVVKATMLDGSDFSGLYNPAELRGLPEILAGFRVITAVIENDDFRIRNAGAD